MTSSKVKITDNSKQRAGISVGDMLNNLHMDLQSFETSKKKTDHTHEKRSVGI